MNGNNRKGDCESQKGYPVQPGSSANTNQSYLPPYTDTPGSVVPPPDAPPSGQVPSGSGQPCGTTPNQQANSGGEDPPGDSVENFEFSDKTIRLGFIRKVYGILMVQLLITVAFISWFLYHDATKQYVLSHPGILFGAFGVTIVCVIVMACCGDVRRKSPINFIFLFLFTLAEAFMLGAISSTYDTETVLIAVGMCSAVCFGLTIFAFQTKWDFTVMGGALFVALIILMVFGIVLIFIPGKILTLIYASCGALLFSLYLVLDTQLMMGGNHKYSISPEEYIFAALNLYLDIVNIFLYILSIIGELQD